MEFFEKLGKKASETFNSAGEKANKIAVETKLKFKINDCKSKIKDLYQDIGKKVYQKYVLDGSLDIKDDITDELSKITQLTDEIEVYEKQILELADMKQCVNCKNKIEKKARYCPECGAEQPEDVAQEVEVVENEEATTEENKETVPQENNEDNEETASQDSNGENTETVSQDNSQLNKDENANQVAENAEEIVKEAVIEENKNENE